jgi:hypothetical protein
MVAATSRFAIRFLLDHLLIFWTFGIWVKGSKSPKTSSYPTFFTQDQTDCGMRPNCDDCDENCETTDTPILDCGHKLDCTGKEDGWYSDEYNCRCPF